VALKTKGFRIIRARGGRVLSGLAAGGSRIRTLGPGHGERGWDRGTVVFVLLFTLGTCALV